MEKIKILDVVALMVAMPEKGLKKGQVGTVVEEWEKGVFEVEFSNKKGQPIAFLAANEKDLLLLHFESIAA